MQLIIIYKADSLCCLVEVESELIFFLLLTCDSIVNMGGEGVSPPNLALSGQSLKNKYSSEPSIFPHIFGMRTNAFPPAFLRDCYMMSCDLLLFKKPQSKQNNIYSQGGTIFVMFNLVCSMEIRNCLKASGTRRF